jgi:hypothetical protein
MNTKITAVLVIMPAILAATALVVPMMTLNAAAQAINEPENEPQRSSCSSSTSSTFEDDVSASIGLGGGGGQCASAAASFPSDLLRNED